MDLPTDSSITVNIPQDPYFVFWGNSHEGRQQWPGSQQDIANASYKFSLTFTSIQEKEVKFRK